MQGRQTVCFALDQAVATNPAHFFGTQANKRPIKDHGDVMLGRRVATSCETTEEPEKSRACRFPALKRQVEIDLEHKLHVTEDHDEDMHLVSLEDIDPGAFKRLPVDLDRS